MITYGEAPFRKPQILGARRPKDRPGVGVVGQAERWSMNGRTKAGTARRQCSRRVAQPPPPMRVEQGHHQPEQRRREALLAAAAEMVIAVPSECLASGLYFPRIRDGQPMQRAGVQPRADVAIPPCAAAMSLLPPLAERDIHHVQRPVRGQRTSGCCRATEPVNGWGFRCAFDAPR